VQLRAPHLWDVLEHQISVKVSPESHSSSLVSSVVSKTFLLHTMQLTAHPAGHSLCPCVNQVRHTVRPPCTSMQRHSSVHTARSRQHVQTVKAIHIDRRQHMELAWKRQQERDGM